MSYHSLILPFQSPSCSAWPGSLRKGKVTLFIVSYFLADDAMLEEAAMGLPVRIHFRGFYSRSSSAVSAEVRMRKGRWTGEGGKPVTSLKWGGRGKSFCPREVTA